MNNPVKYIIVVVMTTMMMLGGKDAWERTPPSYLDRMSGHGMFVNVPTWEGK